MAVAIITPWDYKARDIGVRLDTPISRWMPAIAAVTAAALGGLVAASAGIWLTVFVM